jgi:putative CocE/NonD family hydrolase
VPGSIALGATFNDPVDLDAVGARADVLVYTTEPLDRDIEITGPVRVDLWASTSAPSTDFTAKLVEVFPDRRAAYLCQGVVRVIGAPSEVMSHEIDLSATSVVAKRGHRLRLHVASSEYPTFELNPGTGGRITHDADIAAATQHIFHDTGRPSRVILPIIPR